MKGVKLDSVLVVLFWVEVQQMFRSFSHFLPPPPALDFWICSKIGPSRAAHIFLVLNSPEVPLMFSCFSLRTFDSSHNRTVPESSSNGGCFSRRLVLRPNMIYFPLKLQPTFKLLSRILHKVAVIHSILHSGGERVVSWKTCSTKKGKKSRLFLLNLTLSV